MGNCDKNKDYDSKYLDIVGKENIITPTEQISERAVDYIIENFNIYSIRQDNKTEIWIYKDGIYIQNGKSYLEQELYLILKEKFKSTNVRDIIKKIEARTYIDKYDFFEQEPKDEIAVQNGILNLKTRVLSDFTPKKIFFSKLKCNYDDTSDCEMIKSFIYSIVACQTDIETLQEMVGFLFLKDYMFHKAFMLEGGGRNGKGQFIQIIQKLLSPLNFTALSLNQIENDKFLLINLHKKLANICGDLSSNDLKTTGIFKNLTGGDPIVADRKNTSPVEFINYAKMVFACNQLPITNDNTHAFFDRWVIISFPYTFCDSADIDLKNPLHKLKVPSIAEKITSDSEMSGFLNWALDGLSRLLKNKEFTTNSSTLDVRRKWISKSNSFQAFCEDFIDVGGSTDFIIKSDIRKSYSNFCNKYGLIILSDKKIKSYLTENLSCFDEKLYHSDLTSRPHIWRGIKLKDISVVSEILDVSETNACKELIAQSE